METVFPYPGGKSYMANWVISHFPEHRCYVEAFGGGASVLATKEKSDVEVYNDRDGDLVHFFETLQSKPDQLVEWLESRPYAKDLHDKYGHQFYNGYRPNDDVERAGRFFYLRHSQFAGRYTGYSGFRSSSARNIARQLVNSVEDLEKFADRFRHVQIENRDYEDLVSRLDGENVFFYFDPPYIQEGDDLYSGDNFNHGRFCDVLDGIEGKWLVSYTDIPERLEKYTVVSRERAQHMRKGQPDMKRDVRTERLVMNYDPQEVPMFRGQEQSGLEQYTE